MRTESPVQATWSNRSPGLATFQRPITQGTPSHHGRLGQPQGGDQGHQEQRASGARGRESSGTGESVCRPGMRKDTPARAPDQPAGEGACLLELESPVLEPGRETADDSCGGAAAARRSRHGTRRKRTTASRRARPPPRRAGLTPQIARTGALALLCVDRHAQAGGHGHGDPCEPAIVLEPLGEADGEAEHDPAGGARALQEPLTGNQGKDQKNKNEASVSAIRENATWKPERADMAAAGAPAPGPKVRCARSHRRDRERTRSGSRARSTRCR